jgi:hypothetical protein
MLNDSVPGHHHSHQNCRVAEVLRFAQDFGWRLTPQQRLKFDSVSGQPSQALDSPITGNGISLLPIFCLIQNYPLFITVFDQFIAYFPGI